MHTIKAAVDALTRAAMGIAVEALGGPPSRRVSANGSRRWIEVRGLDGTDGAAAGTAVLAAIRSTAGVRQAVLKSTASRVVVAVDDEGPSTPELCRLVADAEGRVAAPHRQPSATSLPGDDAVLVARTAAAAVAAAGVGLAVTGSLLRLRGFPSALAVRTTLFDHTPRLRGQIEQRLGLDATDLLFAAASSASAALTASPIAAAAEAEAATRTMLAAEAWSARRTWQRQEPGLAADDTSPGGAGRLARADTSQPEGPADRYANRAGAFGIGAAAALGMMTRNADMAGAAALVTAPKPLRASREALGCALTRGLTTHPDALRRHPRCRLSPGPGVLGTGSPARVTAVRSVRTSHRRGWRNSAPRG